MAGKKKAPGKRRTGKAVAKQPRAKTARAPGRARRKSGTRPLPARQPRPVAAKRGAVAEPAAPRGKTPAKTPKAPAGTQARAHVQPQRGPETGAAGRQTKAVEAFCPRCKSETPHTVASMMGEKIRRVRCSSCGTEHNFHRSQTLKMRSVRTEAAAPAKRRREEQRAHSHERLFEEQMLGRDPGLAKAYDLRDKYYQEDLVGHPLFGLGLVTKIKEDGKIEVMFKDGNRTLAHNRFLPPQAPPKKGGR